MTDAVGNVGRHRWPLHVCRPRFAGTSYNLRHAARSDSGSRRHPTLDRPQPATHPCAIGAWTWKREWRSEERRVGTGCVRTYNFRWAPVLYKKQKLKKEKQK